jgi:hypothetical protein
MEAGFVHQNVCVASMRGKGRLTEDCSRCIITSKASFAHTRAVEKFVNTFWSVSCLSCSSDDAALKARVCPGRW